jgi:ABC-2 type transport system ATP-binding protein
MGWMLRATRLVRRFGPRLAVDNVEFAVEPGEIFGLLGPNGAGKTTTLRMLAGLIVPTTGEVLVDGTRMDRASSQRLRGRIGLLTESPGLWEALSVEQNLSVYGQLFGVDRLGAGIEEVLRRFDLWDRRSDRASQLSKGMKQKLALARTLLHDPDIVLLDEPTANLDPSTARDVRELLRELKARGRAIVISTHNLDEVERLADRVALIATRLIAIGKPAALRQELFGQRLRVRLSAPLSGAARASLDTLGLAPASSDGPVLTFDVADPDEAAPRIVRALVVAGAGVRELAEEKPALEEVYLRLLKGDTA